MTIGYPLVREVRFTLRKPRFSMKKVRLLLTAIITTLALSAAACSSPMDVDHTLGSNNHTLGSNNHTLGSNN